MGYVRQVSQPSEEPVTLLEARNFCRVASNFCGDDDLLKGLITAARQYAETFTGRSIAQRQWVMVLDSHPYYTDTVQSQLAYPPSYYSLPRYSTTLWNYSQMIKVPRPPLKSVDEMRYIDTDGNAVILNQDMDFVVDRITEYGRLFPIPGQYWPPDLYVANAVQITFTAGYDADPRAAPDVHPIDRPAKGAATPKDLTGDGQQPDSTVLLAIPQTLRTAILMLTAHWYANREPVTQGMAGKVPCHLDDLLWSDTVIDFAPSRG
jgi:hypothetical protein